MDIARKEKFETGQKSPYKAPPPYIFTIKTIKFIHYFLKTDYSRS